MEQRPSHRPPASNAGAGYAGPSRRQRATIATGVAILFAALLWWFGRISDAARPMHPWEKKLAVFDVPPPPPPPPVVLPPPQMVARASPRPMRFAGGAIGHRRYTPTPVAHDSAPVLFEHPPAPIVDIDATPPASGRNVLAGTDTGGMGGVGVGTGSGRGGGDGTGEDGGGSTPPVRYSRAIWVVPPGPQDFQREWPRGVPRLKAAVHVFLACAVKPDGRPFRCRTLIESRRGLGFASAATRLAERSRVRPVLQDGQWTRLLVIVPIDFMPD